MTARIILVLITMFFLAFGCSDDKSSGPIVEPEALANKITVQSDSVEAHTKFSINVIVENKDQLSGLVIPLSFSGENFTVDSVSFIESRFDTSGLSGIEIYLDENKMVFWHYPNSGEVIDSGSGVAFKIFFWVWGNAPTQEIVIDSTTVNFSVNLGYSDLDYNYFVPDFEQGIIHVDAIQTVSSGRVSLPPGAR
jgi:hypothetical protein